MAELLSQHDVWISAFVSCLLVIELMNYSVLRSIDTLASIFFWALLSSLAFILLIVCPIDEPFIRLAFFLMMGPSLQNSFDISFRKAVAPFQALTPMEYLRWACSPPDTRQASSLEEKRVNRISGKRRLVSGLIQLIPGLTLVMIKVYSGFIGKDGVLFWAYAIGITLLLPSGTFRTLIGSYMLATGSYTKPMFDNPIVSRSVSEFWNRRWNLMFARNALKNIFIPLRRKGMHASIATFAVFMVSGLVHEVLLTVLNGHPNGYNMGFFLLQGIAVNLERAYLNKKLEGQPVLQLALTWGWFVATAPLFYDGFFEAFSRIF